MDAFAGIMESAQTTGPGKNFYNFKKNINTSVSI